MNVPWNFDRLRRWTENEMSRCIEKRPWMHARFLHPYMLKVCIVFRGRIIEVDIIIF